MLSDPSLLDMGFREAVMPRGTRARRTSRNSSITH
jgi:hypothetical protein